MGLQVEKSEERFLPMKKYISAKTMTKLFHFMSKTKNHQGIARVLRTEMEETNGKSGNENHT